MAKKNKPLLNEGTVRRMMQLANMEALGNGFISEKWSGAKAGDEGAGKDKDDTDYSGKGMRKGDESDTGRGKDDIKEQEELELGAEEEEIADVGEVEPAAEPEAEVTITDEEAQDIIDLADKLRDAVGDEGAEEELPPEGGEEIEMEMGAEEELPMEEPGNRSVYEENDELYEAALKGMNLSVVDDDAKRQEAMLQEVKKRVYKRVVSRLLKDRKTQ